MTHTAGKPWTPTETADLRNLWAAGALVTDIATVVGRSAKAVDEKRKREGLPMRDRGIPWSAAEDATLRDLWMLGEPIQQISAAMGRTHSAITNRRFFLRLLPRTRRQPSHMTWTDRDDATLRRLWMSGVSVLDIARKLRRTRGAVLIRRIYLQLPKRGR